MAKQFIKIDDFSGGMDKETSLFNLPLNKATILENVVPVGRGILKLDRNRTTFKYVNGLAETHSNGRGSYSWMDTAGQLVVIFLFDTVEFRAIYDANKLDTAPGFTNFNSSTPIQICDTNVNHSKNSFVQYNGVVRIGGNAAYFPAVITNFTATGGGFSLVRSRFQAWSNYELSGLMAFDDYGAGDDRGCGIYTPEVEKCDDAGLDENGIANPTWTEHQVGIHAVEGAAAASLYVVGDEIRYGVTLEYDFSQESPMAVCGRQNQPHVTIATAGKSVNMRLFVSDGDDVRWPNVVGANGRPVFDERVTGINIYRSINGGDFYHLYRADINSGIYDDAGVHVTWQNGATGGVVNNTIALQELAGGDGYFQDFGYVRYNSYKSRTGFDDYNVYTTVNAGDDVIVQNVANVMIRWNIGCMLRDRAIVNGLAASVEGFIRYGLHKRLYISKPGQPDVFPKHNWIELGVTEQSDFIAIYPLGADRFVAWDSNHCYVVNAASNDPLNWFLEKTYNLGIGTGNAVAVIPQEGLAFANNEGLYLMDLYGSLIEASRGVRSDWRTECDLSGGALHYDKKENTLFVAKSGRTDKFGYQLDFDDKTLIFWSDDANNYGALPGTGIIDQINSFFEDFDGTVMAVHFKNASNLINFFSIESVAANEVDLTYRGPALTGGNYATLKRGTHLWITYKSYSASTNGLKLYLDGGATPVNIGNIPQATVITKAKFDIPYDFQAIQPEVFIDDSNQYFELHEILIGYKTRRPK